ncbi:hypothetical protein MTO96_048694 [Rhipicephalus appendiculatus]
MVVFLMSYTRTGRASPTYIVIAGGTTSAADRSSQQTTAGLSEVTFDPEENFLLQPGETVRDFCERRLEPDPSPVPHTTPLSDDVDVQCEQEGHTAAASNLRLQRQVSPKLQYWRLQDTYLPALLPLHYCSAIVLYGYAIDDFNVMIVWKYPTAKRYVDALRSMKVGRQLLHRGNDIPVYFTLGGEREDSNNLSSVTANNMTRLLLAQNVYREVQNLSTLWAGVNVDWDHPGDLCSPGYH